MSLHPVMEEDGDLVRISLTAPDASSIPAPYLCEMLLFNTHRFASWLVDQEAAGRRFSDEQMEWLRMIRDHVADSLSIGMEDFEYAPFHEKGGPVKVYQVFGGELDELLVELNEALAV